MASPKDAYNPHLMAVDCHLSAVMSYNEWDPRKQPYTKPEEAIGFAQIAANATALADPKAYDEGDAEHPLMSVVGQAVSVLCALQAFEPPPTRSTGKSKTPVLFLPGFVLGWRQEAIQYHLRAARLHLHFVLYRKYI